MSHPTRLHLITPLTRSSPLLTHIRIPSNPHQSRRSAADWQGRQADEHLTNRKDNLNIQASASKAGKTDRASGAQESQSQATGEKDAGSQNEQAKKDHPEAPWPVIGMNDERGGVSFSILF